MVISFCRYGSPLLLLYGHESYLLLMIAITCFGFALLLIVSIHMLVLLLGKPDNFTVLHLLPVMLFTALLNFPLQKSVITHTFFDQVQWLIVC